MNTVICSHNWNDSNGNPEGGQSFGNGFAIAWQRGPLGRGENRQEPNGAFVEDVISACVDRLEFYQDGKFNCEANANALDCLYKALEYLNNRTADREARNVEGTHSV